MISHLVEKLKPLRDMKKESRKSKKLNWTPERRQYSIEVKAALVNLPKLFFINDSDKIRVLLITLFSGYVSLLEDMCAKW